MGSMRRKRPKPAAKNSNPGNAAKRERRYRRVAREIDMPRSLRADYAARMDRVAKRIEDGIAEGAVPTLDELADAAALSRFHFHRLFRLLTGETVGEAITRIRIALAIDAVDSDRATVTAAAHRAGYASSQSLARAARRTTGASITELVGQRDNQAARGEQHDRPFRLEYVSLDPVRICSVATTGPYEALNLAYRGLFEALLASDSDLDVMGVYGIPIDDPRDVAPADHRFRCCIAARLDRVPPGIDVMELADGQYARRRVAATYEALPQLLDATYWRLIDRGIALRDAPAFFHYLDQPGALDGPAVVHDTAIYVPVA
jgi:AraC family transcriptional regulator